MTNVSIGGVLGRQVDAPSEYAPDVLEAVDRVYGRDAIDFGDLPQLYGSDIWHLYELSWLDEDGCAQSWLGVLNIPAQSPAIVESKSLKLYLNSLNFQRFSSSHLAVKTIEQDLETVVGSAVQLVLLAPSEISQITYEPKGNQLDKLKFLSSPNVKQRSDILQVTTNFVSTCYLSHRMRSLCPVTGQPDWATLLVQLHGFELEATSLVQYIDSYREHQEFHEQCVERIFADIWRVATPKKLLVAAFYTRRGGIDITPWRSNLAFVAPHDRMGRQ